jgi:hypothetical protein
MLATEMRPAGKLPVVGAKPYSKCPSATPATALNGTARKAISVGVCNLSLAVAVLAPDRVNFAARPDRLRHHREACYFTGLARMFSNLRRHSKPFKPDSVGAGQQVADGHSSAVAALNKQGVAKFDFRFHGVTAERHPVRRARIATE